MAAVAPSVRVRRSLASFDVRCALGIGLVAFAIRLAFVLAYGRTQVLNLGAGGVGFPFSDTFFYSWVGSALAMGDGYTFLGHTTAHWPPGYPVLLAGVFKVFGADVANALYANAVLGALTVPLVYLVGLRALGRPAAVAAAAALALMPGQILIGDVALAETFYTFELVGFLALAVVLERRPRTFVVLGVVAGLAALTRGEGFLFPLMVLGLWGARGEMRRALRDTAIVTVVMLLTVAPWTIRNAFAVHGFVPVATNASATLWSGHNPDANGGPVYHSPAQLAALANLSEVEASSRTRDDAIDWAVHHPLRELELIPLKLKALAKGDSEVVWTWIDATGAEPLGGSERAVVTRVADAASYALIAALLLTVLVLGRSLWRIPAMRAVLLFVGAAIPLYGFVYYGNVRYRIPLEPFMIIVVAAWAPRIYGRLRPAAVAAAAAALALAGCGGSSGGKQPTTPARLGCHAYCKQTGGYGAPASSPPPMAVVANRAPVKVVAGALPVTVQCRFDRRCKGAILVTLGARELGRSDLDVAAKATRTVAVPLASAGRRALSRAPRSKVLVSLDLGPSWKALPPSERGKWAAVQPGEIAVAR